jgi:hypothetical protein
MPSSMVLFWHLPAWPAIHFYALPNGGNFLIAPEDSRSRVKKKTEKKNKKKNKMIITMTMTKNTQCTLQSGLESVWGP